MQSPHSSPGLGGPPPPNPSSTPRLDIGYSAPVEQSGRRRLQRPDGPPANIGRPAHPSDMNSVIPPDRRPPSRSPVAGGPGRQPVGGQYPLRQDSGPPPGRVSASSTPRPSGPPSQAPQNQSSGGAPPTNKPATKPQTGPKTFEEMGVPQGKNESECVGPLLILILTDWLLT
jgi:hypothetical protein